MTVGDARNDRLLIVLPMPPPSLRLPTVLPMPPCVIPNVVRNLKSWRHWGLFGGKDSCSKEHLRFLVVRFSE